MTIGPSHAVMLGLPGEARFRPSSADTWMNCTGSVALIESLALAKEASTPWQREGTAAHRLAELCLRSDDVTASWVGREIALDDFAEKGPWLVDAEMAHFVQEFLDNVRADLTPGAELLVEYRLTLQPLDPNNALLGENRGTGDVVILDRPRRILRVRDLKYGKGVLVPADSLQPKNYGAMGLADFTDVAWEWVETCIEQPRAADSEGRTIRSITYDPLDLLDFAGQVQMAMMAALVPGAPRTPHPKACRWCRAKAHCPELRASAFGQKATTFRQDPDPSTLVDPKLLTDDELGMIKSRRNMYDLYMDAVDETIARRIEMGRHVPGWKLVAHAGNRQWKDTEPATQASLQALGLRVAEIYTDPKLVSPAQAEKLLPKDKKKAIDGLVVRPLGKPTLVADENARPPAKMFPNPLPDPYAPKQIPG